MLWVAIAVQVAGVALLNLGAVLQKRGADQVPSVHDAPALVTLKNFLRNKPWVAGWLTISVGSIMTFVALGFAPFSILQPFMAVGIIVQGIACATYLKEHVNRGMIVAMIMMGTGVVFIGAASFQQEITFPALVNAMSRATSVFILLFLTGTSILAFAYAKMTGYRKNADIWLSIFTGILSVFSYFFAKAMMAALRELGLGPALFSSLAAWVVFAAMIASSTLAFFVRQVSYQHGRAVLINNLFTAFNIAVPVPIGVLVLDEWAGIATINIAFQAAGLAIILTGIAVMMISELRLKACPAHAVGRAGTDQPPS